MPHTQTESKTSKSDSMLCEKRECSPTPIHALVVIFSKQWLLSASIFPLTDRPFTYLCQLSLFSSCCLNITCS